MAEPVSQNASSALAAGDSAVAQPAEPMDSNTQDSNTSSATTEPIVGGSAAQNAAGDASLAVSSRGPLLPDNPEDTRCYCARDRNLDVAEFQCGMCLRFYHEHCIECEIGSCVPFLTNYQFFCKRCSGQETLSKRQASFSQMCLTAVANLTQQHTDKKLFSKDKEIIPYIESHWEDLTTTARRVKQTWHTTIAKTMMKDPAIFAVCEDNPADQQFGLTALDLTKIGPNCESLFRLTNASYRASMEQKGPPTADTKGRGTKRKGPTDDRPFANKRRGDVSSTRLIPKAYPTEHPYNKDGYRYLLAEPDPHAPNWQAFDESIEWAGKPIPGYLYRTFLEPQVLLALHDRAPQLKLSDDRLSVTGEKGYSMLRASHGVMHGSWYFEASVTYMPSDSACRIGWAQSLGNLQAPCGYDKFSYSWRSKKGTRFHQSRGKSYSSGFRRKDVVGFHIKLPKPTDVTKLTPPLYKDKPLVKFKSHLYYEEKDRVSEAEKTLAVCPDSSMSMYLNGACQGVAFTDVFEGVYYPAVSVHKSCTVKMNFGPKFKHPPKDLKDCKPMSEAPRAAMIEHAMGDMLYHIENEGQQPEF